MLLLRGVFDYDYPEIATMVGKSEANCRQIFHRAQTQIHAQRPRFDVSAATHTAMVHQFINAVQMGELDGLLRLLTEDATFEADGGGKASTVYKKLVSANKVARLLLGFATKGAELFTYATQEINGRLGVLLYNLRGELDTAFVFQMVADANNPVGARIDKIYVIRNPDKLARLAATASEAHAE